MRSSETDLEIEVDPARDVLYPLPRRARAARRETRVHRSAIVERGAEIGEGSEIGPGAIVGSQARLGERVHVGAHAILMGRIEVGDDTRIWPSAVLGGEPQDLAYDGADTLVRIGPRCEIREFVTVHRATGEGSETVIGADVLLMATSHVAHNCNVGDRAIISNGALLAGHVQVGPRASISGNSVVHQFVRIGRLAYLGGVSRVGLDVPPYALHFGTSQLRGINRIGLGRAGFDTEAQAEISALYRLLRRSHPVIVKALPEMRELARRPEGIELVRFMEGPSKRGFCGF